VHNPRRQELGLLMFPKVPPSTGSKPASESSVADYMLHGFTILSLRSAQLSHQTSGWKAQSEGSDSILHLSTRLAVIRLSATVYDEAHQQDLKSDMRILSSESGIRQYREARGCHRQK
jgi:hypothetical protein